MHWHLRITSIESVHSYHMGLIVRWWYVIQGTLNLREFLVYFSQSDPEFFSSSGGASILLVTEDEGKNGMVRGIDFCCCFDQRTIVYVVMFQKDNNLCQAAGAPHGGL